MKLCLVNWNWNIIFKVCIWDRMKKVFFRGLHIFVVNRSIFILDCLANYTPKDDREAQRWAGCPSLASPASIGSWGAPTMSWASGLWWAPSWGLAPQTILRHISREATATVSVVLLQAVSSLLIVGTDISQDLTWELTETLVTSGWVKEADGLRTTICWILTGCLGCARCFPRVR